MTRADHPEFREVSDEMLADKQSMCKEYLKLLDKVEPGMTKMRGWWTRSRYKFDS